MRNKIVTEGLKKALDIIQRHRVIIYGAGTGTEKLLDLAESNGCKHNVAAILDSNLAKQGTEMAGLKIYGPDYLDHMPAADVIIVNVRSRQASDEVFAAIKRFAADYRIVELAYLENFNNRILNDSVLNDSTTIEGLLRFVSSFGEMPIAIYQMGKVGSRTIYHTLDQAGIFGWHIHLLSKKLNDWRGTYKVDTPLPELLRKASGNEQFKVRIITLVRDPIARNMASFFQNVQKWFPDILTRYEEKPEETVQFAVDRFINFWSQYDHHLPITWWGNELQDVFGVNAIDGQFPKDKGYRIIKQDLVEVLVIKMEMLNEVYAQAICEFLGLRNLELDNKNLGEAKSYKDLYRDFKNAIVLPQEYLDKFYQAAEVQEFYTEDEIAASINRLKRSRNV